MWVKSVLVSCLICLFIRNADNAAMQAISVRNALYEVPGLGNRPLIIKMYPAVENFQSDLYEVYAEPYNYVRQLPLTQNSVGIVSFIGFKGRQCGGCDPRGGRRSCKGRDCVLPEAPTDRAHPGQREPDRLTSREARVACSPVRRLEARVRQARVPF